jgi:hypothetical protein
MISTRRVCCWRKIKKNQRIKKRIKFCRCPICWARERETHTVASTHTHTHNGMLLPSLLDALRLLTTHPPTTTTIISSGGGMEKSKTQKNGIEDKLDWRFFGFTFFQTRNHTQWPPASQIKVCQQLETAHTHTRVFSSFWGVCCKPWTTLYNKTKGGELYTHTTLF